jgi:hypothetical protein
MPDTVLDLTTRVDLESLTAGMANAVRAVSSSTGRILSDFAKLASGTQGSLDKIELDIADLKVGFTQLASVVSEAMQRLGTSTAAGAREAGGALDTLKEKTAETAESMKAALE